MSKKLIEVINNIKHSIKSSLTNAIKDGLLPDVQFPEAHIEFPALRQHGELSSNIAMMSAKAFRMSPKKIADIVLSGMKGQNKYIKNAEIAGNGFINFFLSDKFFLEVLQEIVNSKGNYGKSDYGQHKKVMIEFVSANPTGPVHIGNARGGALGDSLASVFQAAGFDVTREFYINDAGNQIEKFAKSLDIRYQQICNGLNSVELPEDCYHGEDIIELAQEFFEIYSNKYINMDSELRKKALLNFALPKNIKKMQEDMKKYNIKFDNWFHESSLYEKGEVQKTIDELTNIGLTYKSNNALWYKATNFGAEKDEVLVRNNGIPTYFASDIAYHVNKFLVRNYDICIDIWGADHHGHISRLKNALDALNIDSKNLHILLFQLVKIVQNGEILKMSKRTGKAIQLSDLLDEVNPDSARFIFSMREPNTKMDFDLDKAISHDMQNPVYYVQYAYSRICSIFKNYHKNESDINFDNINFNFINGEQEKEIIFHMSKLTFEIIEITKNFDPTKLTRYIIILAEFFHKYYGNVRVVSNNAGLTMGRLCICYCIKIVLQNILNMFKISQPKYM